MNSIEDTKSYKSAWQSVGCIMGPFFLIGLLYLFVQVRDTYQYIQQSSAIVGTIEKWEPQMVFDEDGGYHVYVVHVRFQDTSGSTLTKKMPSDFDMDVSELQVGLQPDLPATGTQVDILYNPTKSPPEIRLNHWASIWKSTLIAGVLLLIILMVAVWMMSLETKKSQAKAT